MDDLIKRLIQLANTLDNAKLYKQASHIDFLIKEAGKEVERFWAKVDKKSAPIKNKRLGRCWLWIGAKDRNGYGVVRIGGKNYSAHRLSWEWANNQKIPDGMVLIHLCDEPSCVKPSHLTIGTQINNIEDRVKKNRSARGQQNGKARLTEKDVKLIKKLRGRGMTESSIAELLEVSRSAVANVLHHRSWGWVSD